MAYCELCMPVRYLIAFLLFIGTIVSAILRININVIIPVLLPKNKSHWDFNMICEGYNSTHKIKHPGAKMYLSEYDETLVMSAFYWGYCLSGMVSGYVVEQWGPTRVTAISTMSSSLMTLLMPVVHQGSMVNIAALRLVIGLGEGVTLNSLKKLLISWSPVQERKHFSNILYGTVFGAVLAYPLFGLLLYYLHWSAISYFVGTFCMLWAAVFIIWVGDGPATYKNISVAEREYIESNQLQNVSFYSRRRRRKIPWVKFISSECVLALQILLFTNTWNLFFFTDYMPLYIHTAMGMSLSDAACYSALPILCRGLGSFPSNWLSKYLMKKWRMNVTLVRKLFTIFSHIVPGVLLQSLAVHPNLYTSKVKNMVLINTIMFFNGNIVSGGVPNTMDLTPHLAGSLYNILYNVSNLSGLIMPYTIVAFIHAKKDITCGWNYVLTLQSSMYLFGGTIFLCLGSGKEQSWDAEYVQKKNQQLVSPSGENSLLPEGISNFYHKIPSPSTSEHSARK